MPPVEWKEKALLYLKILIFVSFINAEVDFLQEDWYGVILWSFLGVYAVGSYILRSKQE